MEQRSKAEQVQPNWPLFFPINFVSVVFSVEELESFSFLCLHLEEDFFCGSCTMPFQPVKSKGAAVRKEGILELEACVHSVGAF